MHTIQRPLRTLSILGLGLMVACAGGGLAEDAPSLDRAAEEDRVDSVLDSLHRAASEADGATYFALFRPDAVFLGTDATERWSMDEFRAFAEPHFSSGRGWSYESTERHIFLSAAGDVAWFDERLWNGPYGETRGSGVLVRTGPPGSTWHFTQYNLCFPVPNDLAKDLVERIRAVDGEE